MRWFGESWGAVVCRLDEHMATPDGEVCPGCQRSIRAGDQGFEIPYIVSRDPYDRDVDLHYWHRWCLLGELVRMPPNVGKLGE